VSDRTPDIIGTHPFRVEVYFGDERWRAYVTAGDGVATGPGVQVLTPRGEEALAASNVNGITELHQVAGRLGTDFPFLLNVACTINGDNFARRVEQLAAAAGRTAIEARDALALDGLKRAVDQAQGLGPRAIIRTAMEYLVRPMEPGGPSYGTLVDHLNQVLVNASRNPRMGSPHPPIAGVQDIAPEGMQLWWVKEGSATIVFQVRVALAGGRPPVRFVVNVAKDQTSAAAQLRQTYADFVEFYRMEPASIMEPLGSADVLISTWRGVAPAAVLAAEWFDGHELHVYEGSSRLHVWMDQRMAKDHPIPPDVSDRVWEQVTRMRARFTRMTPSGLVPIATHVNAGDYIFRSRADGEWDVMLIWTRRPPDTIPPGDFIVLAGLLDGVNVFGSEQGKTVWWDQPERALQALRQGLAQAGLTAGQIHDLLRQAHDGVFTAFNERPEQLPHLALAHTADPAELRQVFRRAKDALATFLASAKA
jgi:hypothetical protein